MTSDDELLEDSAEDLFEDAPCGYLVDAARTGRSCGSTGRSRRGRGCAARSSLGTRRFQDLLSPGRPDLPRDPLRAAAADAGLGARDRGGDRARGRHAPARAGQLGAPQRRRRAARSCVRTTVFDATDRRRYEQELLRARRQEQESRSAAAAQPAVGRAARARRARASRSPTARPSAGPRGRRRLVRRVLARRGRRRSGSSSATWSAAGSTRRRRWASCAARCARSPRPGSARGAARRARRLRAPARGRPHDDADLRPARPRLRAGLRYACAGHPPPVILTPGRGAGVRLGGPLDAARRHDRRRRTAARGRAHAPARQHGAALHGRSRSSGARSR